MGEGARVVSGNPIVLFSPALASLPNFPRNGSISGCVIRDPNKVIPGLAARGVLATAALARLRPGPGEARVVARG